MIVFCKHYRNPCRRRRQRSSVRIPNPTGHTSAQVSLDHSPTYEQQLMIRSLITSRSHWPTRPTPQKGHQRRSSIVPPHSTKHYIRSRRANTIKRPNHGHRDHPPTRFPIILPFPKCNRTIPRPTPILDSGPSITTTPLIRCLVLLETISANAAYHD